MTVRDVDSSSTYNLLVFSFENKPDLVRTSCPILADDVFVQLPFASPNGFEFCCSEARIVESQTEIIILVNTDEKKNWQDQPNPYLCTRDTPILASITNMTR
jgi:hypothetical protein